MSEYAFVNLNRKVAFIADTNLNMRGGWDSAATYSPPSDTVNFNGDLWLALTANTNVSPTPGTNWSMLVPLGADEFVGNSSVKTIDFTNLIAFNNQTVPHGLGRVPIVLSSALVCVTDDAGTGMTAGQQVELVALFDQFNSCVAITVGSDATNFYLSFPSNQGFNLWINIFGANNGPTDAPALAKPLVFKTGGGGSKPVIANFKVTVWYI